MANYIDTVAVSSRIGGKNAIGYTNGERRLPESHSLQKEHPFDELTTRSRRRLVEERQRLMGLEGEEKDYPILASEATILPSCDGLDHEAVQTHIAASTFGRKNGNGATTVLTYVDMPSSGSGSVSAGYIEACLNDRDEKVYRKKPIMNYPSYSKTDTDIIQQYASGVTEEILHMADRVGRFEHEVEPVMQHLVANHPFNTLSFYSKSGSDARRLFYEHITSSENGYFSENGGNCVLFTIQAARKLDDMDFRFKVALIPPSNVLPSGHTALIVSDRSDQLSFFVDPGLSLTQPIVLSDAIPVYPFAFDSNKQIFVSYDNHGSPSVRIHTKKAKSNLIIEKPVAYHEFLSMAPSILEDMDRTRTQAKLDYHRSDGTSIFSCTVNLGNNTLSLRGGGHKVQDVPIGTFLLDAPLHHGLGTYLADNGLSLEYLLQQLAKPA